MGGGLTRVAVLLGAGAACNSGTTAREGADAAPPGDAAMVDAETPADAMPSWQPWSLQLIGPYQEEVQLAAAAADGSVFLAGQIQVSAVLGSKTMAVEGSSNAFFLARVTADGDVTWARGFGGSDDSEAIMLADMAVTPSGDVVVTGRFRGTIDLGGEQPMLGVGQTFDFFVATFSGDDGSLVWSRDYGGPSWDAGTAVGVAPDGDVVVAGTIDGYVQVGGDFLGPTVFRDVFLARYAAADGAHRWSRRLPGPVAEEVTALDVDADGAILAAGVFWAEDPADEGPPPIQIARFEPDGDLLWASDLLTYPNSIWALAAATDGDAIAAGTFQGDVTIGGMAEHSDGTSSFFARVDAENHQVHWVTTAGDAGATAVTQLAATADGRVVGAGSLQGQASFGGDDLDSGGGQAALLLELDGGSGDAGGGATFGSVGARAQAVAARQGGGVVLVGTFRGDIDLGSGGITADTYGDGFAALLPP